LEPTKYEGRENYKDNKRAGAERIFWGRNDRRFISGGRKTVIYLQDSQALLGRPYGKDRIKVKILG
jgi:hypothetical protein